MVAAEKFWDRHAAGYAKRPVKNVAAYEQTLQRTRAYLSPTDRVLEIGCGTGTTALKLARDVAHMTGTDISPAMTEIARAKAVNEGCLAVDFTSCDASAPGFPDGGFDVVLAFNLLHLLPDAEGTLARVHALLKPGGYFISKTACMREMSVLWRPLILVMQAIGFAPYLRRFSKAELDDVISGAGFEILEGRCFDGAPASWFAAARKPLAERRGD